jgi:hypothetical protein
VGFYSRFRDCNILPRFAGCCDSLDDRYSLGVRLRGSTFATKQWQFILTAVVVMLKPGLVVVSV